MTVPREFGVQEDTFGGPAAVWVWRGFMPAQQAAATAQAVLDVRASWTSDFGGLQFALGSAWYSHLETRQSAAYFAGAASSDQRVEQALPGLQQRMRDAVAAGVGAEVRQRAGWCGAGVHIFPAGGVCAQNGGDVHADDQGLTRAHLREGLPARSLVLMLQPAERGGCLRLWDRRWGETERLAANLDRVRTVDVHLKAGDLVAFDSYQVHQIQPFGGRLDRISATLHAAWAGAAWETWF